MHGHRATAKGGGGGGGGGCMEALRDRLKCLKKSIIISNRYSLFKGLKKAFLRVLKRGVAIIGNFIPG